MSFKDHFSKQSQAYRRYRPHYPRELFAFIASQCLEHHTVLDCATGTGQAAIALVEFFDRVIAMDASEAQLSHAVQHERIEYRQAEAEDLDVASHSIDCVTVAQALHWFNLEAFFKEVKRVLVPGGILAVWCYPIMHCADSDVDTLLQTFYSKTLGFYWPKERHYVDEAYASISFPFKVIEAPCFREVKQWTKDDFAGYLGTWSAVQKYEEAQGFNPVRRFIDDLIVPIWDDPSDKKFFSFEFPMRIARV